MLFIYPDLGGNSISFSPAIEILSSVLNEQGINTHLIHLHTVHGMPFDYDLIYQKVLSINPDIIGITSTTYQYQISNQIAGDFKKRGITTPIILGGIHAIITPDDLDNSNFDAFCIGEGEVPLSELFRRLAVNADITTVPGFYFKKGEKVIKNYYSEVIADLDQLPFRNYELMNAFKLLKVRDNWLSISFSRGCPYSCNFCINQKLKDIHRKSSSSKYFRTQSVERAIKELRYLVKKYVNEIKLFNLDDDLLMLDRNWFLEFAKRFRDEIYLPYRIRYAINVRANLIDEEIIAMLKESGCHLTRVGFETGDENMRNKVLGKGISNEDLFRTFNLFHKYNLRSLAFSMIGIPDESEDTVKSSLEMLRVLKPTLIRLAFFEPFVGTPMYDYCNQNNFFKDDYRLAGNTFLETSLRFDKISSHALALYHLLFPWYLNIEFVKTQKEKYQRLIEKYRILAEEELLKELTRKHVLEDDRKISAELSEEGIEHFEYFNNNNFYYHLKGAASDE